MITVRVTRWRAPGWRWWSRGGLEMDIDGHGTNRHTGTVILIRPGYGAPLSALL